MNPRKTVKCLQDIPSSEPPPSFLSCNWLACRSQGPVIQKNERYINSKYQGILPKASSKLWKLNYLLISNSNSIYTGISTAFLIDDTEQMTTNLQEFSLSIWGTSSYHMTSRLFCILNLNKRNCKRQYYTQKQKLQLYQSFCGIYKIRFIFGFLLLIMCFQI